jgi:hypothetical protein
MKILYIGPYRQNNSEGYLSLNLLLSCYLYSQEVLSRPIYNSQNLLKLENHEKLVSSLENNTINTFDVIIQHLDIDSMIYTSKIPKHIFIPILNNKKPSFFQKQKLSFLETKGLFVSCDKISSYILKNESLKYNTQIDVDVDLGLISKTTGSFNFGLYNRYNKYYSIVDSYNENDIKELILHFIQKYQNDSVCLVLFMTNVSQSVLDKYNSYIKNIYKNLKINYSINKIIIAPIELNHEILSAIHNTGNIYLDLENNIFAAYAKEYNKTVLYNKADFEYCFDINNIEEYPTIKYNKTFDWLPVIKNHNEQYFLSQVLTDYV